MSPQEQSLSIIHLQQLQAELITTQQQREQAQAEATKWRRRYEVEAQQRRQEVECAEANIEELKANIEQLCSLSSTPPLALSPTRSEFDSSTSDADPSLQSLLSQALAERDQLAQALAEERARHIKTRENLMHTLMDALKIQSQTHERPLSLPESRHGARAGSIIRKDRANRQPDSSLLNSI